MWPFNDDLMRFDFEADEDIITPNILPFLPQCVAESRMKEAVQA